MSTDYDAEHCSDDDVSLAALGEVIGSHQAQHLRACGRCSARVLELRDVVDTARDARADELLVRPPADLWDRIAAEAFGGSAVADLEEPDREASPSGSNVVPLRRGLRRTAAVVATIAAASGILVGGFATWVVASRAGGEPALIASAALVRPDSDARMGTATLQRTSDGLALAVTAADLPAPDGGYYEVWMASPDTVTMVAVGTINPGGTAVLPLPSTMDTGAFPVVDISLEQFDGNTGHSSISVARATF